MSTTYNPPQPPAPPSPPRSGSNIVAIVLLVLALIVVLCIGAIWVGVRFVSHEVRVSQRGEDGHKTVSIQTPVGSLEVRKETDVSEMSLGLPFYPGATRVQGDGSAGVSLSLPGSQALRIVAAKFETPDGKGKVASYYEKRLTQEVGPFTHRNDLGEDDHNFNGDVGNFSGTDSEGNIVFQIKRKGEIRVAAVKHGAGHTRIDLVRIQHGPAEAN